MKNQPVWLRFFFCGILFLFGMGVYFQTGNLSLQAETLYLKNGESMQGSIIKIEQGYIYLESNLGYGIIKLPRSQVSMVTFPNLDRVDLTRRYAIGYVSNGLRKTTETEYTTDQISFRTFFTQDLFLDYLLGYHKYGGKKGANSTPYYSVLQLDIRGALVLINRQDSIIYAGVSAGSSQREVAGKNESGAQLSAFLGLEFYFPNLPNLGFSGEVAFRTVQNQSTYSYNLGASPAPLLSVHYYF